MDIAEAMELFRASNSDAAGIVQAKLSELGGEAGDNRRDNTDLKKQMAEMQTTFGELAKKIGAADVKDVPKVVETQNAEFKAILEQQKQANATIETLMNESKENKRIMGRSAIKEELKVMFKDYKDPDYQAELYADKAIKGETGLLIGGKFATEVIKELAISQPYQLSKNITDTTITDTTGSDLTGDTKVFTEDEIMKMSDEEFTKNEDAILAQEDV